MPEHRIRFRGGWEIVGASGHSALDRKLTLPTVWPTGLVVPIRLARRFGRPPIDPATESARLELKDVPGLQRVSLNGIDLGSPPNVSDWTVELGEDMASRNTLTLELIPGRVDPGELPEGWGSIALVVVSKDERLA